MTNKNNRLLCGYIFAINSVQPKVSMHIDYVFAYVYVMKLFCLFEDYEKMIHVLIISIICFWNVWCQVLIKMKNVTISG